MYNLLLFTACAVLFSSGSIAQDNGLPAGMVFVSIEGGTFPMGSPETEASRNPDELLHEVTVQSFELMTTEVTQSMWEEIMGESNASEAYGLGDDYPVYYVSWDQSLEFTARLNEMDPSHNYRLPTEAEWEYACRAGSGTPYFWDDVSMQGGIEQFCWFLSNSDEKANPVATKEPNAFGLYDMNGNVNEWCQDVYTSDYSNCPSDGTAYEGPGDARVHRGGNWSLIAKWFRSAVRYSATPGSRRNNIGFRVVRS